MNVAIIPARGGSIRLKNKNIYTLGGKPLIQWSVDAALESGCFDEIIVSSDSDKILSTVVGDVVLHKRDYMFATKEIPVIELILDFAVENKKLYDTITCLLPTCPFRSAPRIREAFSFINEVDSVVSVVEYKEPIQLAGELYEGFFEPYFSSLVNNETNSLNMRKYYRPNGGLYIANIPSLIEKRSFFKGDIGAVLMDRRESQDIDDLFDMKIAELMVQGVL